MQNGTPIPQSYAAMHVYRMYRDGGNDFGRSSYQNETDACRRPSSGTTRPGISNRFKRLLQATIFRAEKNRIDARILTSEIDTDADCDELSGERSYYTNGRFKISSTHDQWPSAEDTFAFGPVSEY